MIRKSVLLACDAGAVFELFTARVADWWPESRRHLPGNDSQLFLLESGRFFERGRSGEEVDLGKVKAWEPPRRLVLDFYVGTDAQHPTQSASASSLRGRGRG